jgi:hypothetical protein
MGLACNEDETIKIIYRIVAGKPLAMCPFRNRRIIWEDKVRINFRDVNCEDGR